MPSQTNRKPPTGSPARRPSQTVAKPKDARPSVHLNVEEWLPYLDHPDATDEEKRELIETLWGIVLSFVDLGYQITPEDKVCMDLPPDNDAPSIDLTRALHAIVLELDDHQQMEEE